MYLNDHEYIHKLHVDVVVCVDDEYTVNILIHLHPSLLLGLFQLHSIKFLTQSTIKITIIIFNISYRKTKFIFYIIDIFDKCIEAKRLMLKRGGRGGGE